MEESNHRSRLTGNTRLFLVWPSETRQQERSQGAGKVFSTWSLLPGSAASSCERSSFPSVLQLETELQQLPLLD